MANKKSKKEEFDFKPKALVYAYNEETVEELNNYAKNIGYEVIHKLSFFRSCINEQNVAFLLEEILKLYQKEKFDYVIVSNLFSISETTEVLSAFCILLSEFNITLISKNFNEGTYGINYVFDIKKKDNINNARYREKAVILLNEAIDDNIDITERNLWLYALSQYYDVVNTIIVNEENFSTDDCATDILRIVIDEREKYYFDRLLVLNNWQLSNYSNAFMSLCVLLSENDIIVDTLYRGNFLDWEYTIKKD